MALSQSILVATDFSEAAKAGLVKAGELAREVGGKVTVCHVLDPSPLAPISGKDDSKEGDLEKAVHTALEELLAEHFSDVDERKTALIVSPNPAEGICHYAQKEDTSLIVMSTHGRTGLAHLMIGSVAERVVRHAPCPVLTVRASGD